MRHSTENDQTRCLLMEVGWSIAARNWIILGMLLNMTEVALNSQVGLVSLLFPVTYAL